MKTLSFAIWRLASTLPTLFAVITISFFLMRFAPGGPFNLERPLPPQVMQNLLQTYSLDQPLWKQYISYIANVATGDFGPSYIYKENSVAELITKGLSFSAKLGICALTLALVLGIAFGTLAALRRNGLIDFALMSISSIGITVPNFVIGPVSILVFSLGLSWLPAGGWGDGSAYHLILPIVVLALPQLAVFARLTRGSMIEALKADHIRTARAYGFPTWAVVIVHAMRSAILPVVSYLAPCAAALLTGSAVVETIFTIPGLGRYFVLGALNRDYTLVMGMVVTVAVFVIFFNFLVDLLYGLLDPRVRHE